ncbi:hypothetical protein DPMN_164321 [Dreissena polymorpha]|uniref:Uncharacterized protein n=1 Tax=Dreissena polymorpha TaxID=45954 RepID=A0A9D4IS91_DREPO|nr:hypothetical protein DPMN_164321 [Dreissena polymorpha]
MDDLRGMNLEKYKLWSIHALIVFLSKRKADVDGSFDELCARAFCAWEQRLPVDAEAECREMRLLEENNAKLSVDGGVLPDPMMLNSG